MSNYNPFSGYESRKVEERKVEAERKANTTPTGTVSEIKDGVGDDKDKAKKALDAENANDKPRKSLVEALEAIITPASPEPKTVAPETPSSVSEAQGNTQSA